MTKSITVGILLLPLVAAAVTNAQEVGKANAIARAEATQSANASGKKQKTEGAEKKSLASIEGGKQAQAAPATDDPTYVIGPADMLDITVWKEPDFSRVVQVRPDGKISLPLLKDLQASALTAMQLATLISMVLRKYVTQPQVTVIVTQINSKRAYVLGEVNRPGPVSLTPKMTVLEALSTAGGFTQFANQKGIYILRNENGKQNRYAFNYKKAIRGEAAQQNIILKPGDTIVVP